MDKLIRELTLEEEGLVSAGMDRDYNYDVRNLPANLLPHRLANGGQNIATRKDWKAFQRRQQNQVNPYTYGRSKDKRKRCLTGSY